MRSVIVNPFDKREFDVAFSLLIEFGKDRNRLSLEEDEEISFAFLMKEKESISEISVTLETKKTAR
jgi:hypothetical protein